mgnify:CR=1 FL=1
MASRTRNAGRTTFLSPEMQAFLRRRLQELAGTLRSDNAGIQLNRTFPLLAPFLKNDLIEILYQGFLDIGQPSFFRVSGTSATQNAIDHCSG